MPRPPQHVTDAELAVLEVLWRHGACSVRQLTDHIYPGGGNSELATVQKLCERLLAKGHVGADRDARPRTYEAQIDRESLIGRHLETVADRFCSGSFLPLLSQLVDGGKLSRDEIDSLRAQIERLDDDGLGEGERRP